MISLKGFIRKIFDHTVSIKVQEFSRHSDLSVFQTLRSDHLPSWRSIFSTWPVNHSSLQRHSLTLGVSVWPPLFGQTEWDRHRTECGSILVLLGWHAQFRVYRPYNCEVILVSIHRKTLAKWMSTLISLYSSEGISEVNVYPDSVLGVTNSRFYAYLGPPPLSSR